MREIVLEFAAEESVIIGDFNVNWLSETDRRPLYNAMVRDNSYVQLISDYTTDNKTLIDHIFSKMTSQTVNSGILETYFSDHKTIWVSFFQSGKISPNKSISISFSLFKEKRKFVTKLY